ncbi:tissue factor-like [Hypanus sabinus]|uniref:tissue factor-like n=1 Tax=Hypanus sabinus TaxID=79690 RepID=UPI0028C45E5D|nr:tissue factor-like [Hypanus sabinus]
MGCGVVTLGFIILCLHFGHVSGTSLKPVTNVKWKSFNFFTILEWEKTSENAMYTVRLSSTNSDWKKKPECTMVTATSCDLTSLMQDVNASYSAEVQSYNTDNTGGIEEPPFARSPKIQLLKDTQIGQATFNITKKNETKIQLTITDPITYIKFPNNTRKTLRDIYGSELEYRMVYWKDGTSGKKKETVKGQVIVMEIEPAYSYCFSIQPHIRLPYKEGQKSLDKCIHANKSFTTEYGFGMLALIGLGALLLLSIIIVITVYLCRRKTVTNVPETDPLKA